MPNKDIANLEFLDRVSEELIEFQIGYQALTTNGVRMDELVSFLSENGFGDEVSQGRIARAADRLVDEGKVIVKNNVYKLTSDGEEDVRRLTNLMLRMVPEEAPEPSEQETTAKIGPPNWHTTP